MNLRVNPRIKSGDAGDEQGQINFVEMRS